MQEELRPKVGVGVMIFKDDKVLLCRRKSSHGTGEWGGQGGHMEHLESFEDTVRREAMEEVGIEIDNIQFLCVANVTEYAPKHYIDVGFTADWKSGEPKICEPEKCDEIGWFSLDDLPEPLFGPERVYIEAYKTKQQFFDA